ncbi:MAG TPA: WG repeat-containing protein [Bacteroidales bacterium]|nr:WG repeat-containing protein [Bacteroidales bacterium]HPT11788.1 WG repeat-containing protein [Bacteroidales bacterium]
MRKFAVMLLLFNSLNVFSQKYSIFTENELNGVKNEQGKIIIKPRYQYIEQNRKNYFLVTEVKKGSQVERTILDSLGKEVTKIGEIKAGSFSGGFFKSSGPVSGYKMALFDENIRIINTGNISLWDVSIWGDYCFVFDKTPVNEGDAPGRIFSKTWEDKGTFEGYKLLSYFEWGKEDQYLFMLKKNGRWGLYNTGNMSEILAPKYDEIGSSSGYFFSGSSVFVLKSGGLTGYYNATTGALVDPKYTRFIKYTNDQYIGEYDHRFDILTKDKILYSFAGYDMATMAETMTDTKYVYVGKNNKMGVISLDGRIVVPVAYDSISYSTSNTNDRNELVVTTYDKKSGLQGLYSTTRKEITPPAYPAIKYLNDTMMIVNKNNRWGVLRNKKPCLAFKYDAVEPFDAYARANNAILRVKRGNKYGLVNIVRGDSTGCNFSRLEEVGPADRTLGAIYTARKGNKYQFVYSGDFKKTGSPQFDTCMTSSQELAFDIVRLYDNNQLRYYNLRTGKSLGPLSRIGSWFDSDGYSRITFNGESFFVNRNLDKVSDDIVFDPDFNYLLVFITRDAASDYHITPGNPLIVDITDEDSNSTITRQITGGITSDIDIFTPQDYDYVGFTMVKLERNKYYNLHAYIKSIYSNQPPIMEWKSPINNSSFAESYKLRFQLK